MIEPGRTWPSGQGRHRVPAKVVILSVLLTVILSGLLPFLSLVQRFTTWILWGGIVLIIALFAKELPLRRLIRPMVPYLGWLVFYLTWAVIVSPLTRIGAAGKLVATTLILGTSIAILASRARYLQVFASIAQLALVFNLALYFIMLRSTFIESMIRQVFNESSSYVAESARYGGTWGNPNMLGYICLITTILSVLAGPVMAWVGRLSALPLLYFSASRKASILYLLILAAYLFYVQRRNYKFWMASAAVGIALAMAMALSDGLRAETRSLSENKSISRIMDVSEEKTKEAGGETRLDLLHHWTSALAQEPWYGYGFQAMGGTITDDAHPDKVLMRGVYPVGTHNTYLGIYVEIGPVGFISFLIMLVYYARLSLVTGDGPVSRWVMFSIMLCNLAYLMVSHSQLFCFEGEISYTLWYVLLSCAGLRELGGRNARRV